MSYYDLSTRRSCATRACTTPSAHANGPHQTYVPLSPRLPDCARTTLTNEHHTPPRQLRNPSRTCRHVRPPRSAPHSRPSRTGSPRLMQCTRHGSRRSRPLPCMRAFTARRSAVSGMRTPRSVRVCTSLGRGMRRRLRCWEQNARSGALRHCGKYLGSMRTKEGMTQGLERKYRALRATEYVLEDQ